MKKALTMFIAIVATLALLGCQNLDYNPYATPKSYDIYDVYVIGKNQVVDIEYVGLTEAGYDYDELVYFIENDDVARITNGDQVKGRAAGKTRVFATMYKDSGNGLKPIGNVVIGTFVVIDLESDSFTEITTYSEFQSLLQNNPNGLFYLGDDIVFPMSVDFEIIDEFKGVLINPYGYSVYNLKGSQSIFHTLENAYIEGLIFEEADLYGTLSSGLALYSEHTTIRDVHFFASSIQSESDAAGLVIQAINTVFESVSYEGFIEADGTVGGLIAFADNGALEETYFKEHLLKNAYAYADITNHHADAVSAGLIGTILHYGVLESSYSGGVLTGENRYAISANVDQENIYYIYLYTTFDDAYLTHEAIAYDQLYTITETDLFTGTMLPGLEEFDFNSGSNPKN